ncbi:MAG: DUF3604 domain-containing protein [Chitinophagales bacterium]
MQSKQQLILTYIFISTLFFSCNSETQQKENSSAENIEETEKTTDSTQKTADFNEQKNAYFGDLHVHTSWSFDAFIYNVRTTPDDAYRFGKGDSIAHFTAGSVQLQRPLDFMAVSDHSEYMGIMKQMIDPNSPLAALEIAKEIRSEDKAISMGAFAKVGQSIARNQPMSELVEKEIIQNTWERLVEAANKHNEPGKFTTFPAYEWTSSPVGPNSNEKMVYAANMHRNVIYKSEKVSEVPFSSFNSQNPEDLWAWMDKERSKGIELLAIPHNGNMSDGLMYDLQTSDKKPFTKEYAETRSRNEPVNEVVQIKGQSMAHPVLAPNDEFANFEIFAFTFSTSVPPPSKPEGSYVRNALQNGLALEKELGANPFKFGLIGSSDGHNSAGATEENNYFGKFGSLDGDPKSRIIGDDKKFLRAKFMSAAGLAGVWAEENTREAIFEALERKETFATSGPRIKVRFFGGWEYDENALSGDDWVKNAYQKGVSMGRDLPKSAQTESPNFLIWAVKDAEGANLDRIQVVKGWVDAEGKTHEKIFDVVWSDNRQLDDKGKLPEVGNTVNIKEASYTNDIGAVTLQSVWKDPEFDSTQSAVYYLRVLEIPTPRWSTFDAKTMGIAPPKDVDKTIQERAWSSPIWYTPK